ncbi:hypothetical protein [Ensifer sp. MJa1]|uniref:COG3904 family protein n=1 Tax=Ensifer sp. MJa1 TaxID=2919888 RepID=UPI00300A2695
MAGLKHCDHAIKLREEASEANAWLQVHPRKGTMRYLLSFLLAIVIAASPFAGALASSYAPDSPMTFQIVRSSSPECEPTCPEWIVAAGSIEPDTPASLRKLLKTLGSRRLPIVIASNGGDRPAALEVGRIIRKQKLTVAIGFANTIKCQAKPSVCRKIPFVPGTPRFDGINCISGCVYLFGGGVVRLNAPGNVVGLHKGSMVIYSRDNKSFKAMKDAKRAERMMRKAKQEIATYLSEMGIKTELVEKAHSQEGVYEVPWDEQLSWGLVTGLIQEQDFTNPGACKSQPAPVNCVTRATTD